MSARAIHYRRGQWRACDTPVSGKTIYADDVRDVTCTRCLDRLMRMGNADAMARILAEAKA